MSLAIDSDRICAVLLEDGWHEGDDDPDYVDILYGGGTGYSFEEPGTGTVMAGRGAISQENL